MNSDPYFNLKHLPIFKLASSDVSDGSRLPPAQLSIRLGGQDLSPHLAWSDFPQETKSFVVTMFDPDAPTPSGFWHWAVFNIPNTTTELQRGDGNDIACLPKGSVVLQNDRGLRTFIGANPPLGTGKHRYYIVVYALDIEKLEIPESSTPAFLTFNLLPHTLAWAKVAPWYENADN